MLIVAHPSTDRAACPDFPQQHGSSRAVNRILGPAATGANSGFGGRLAALRKAAGFNKRQVLKLIDACIGRGQLKRTVWSRA